LSVVTLRPTGPPSSRNAHRNGGTRAVTGIISENELPSSPMHSGHPIIPSTNESMNSIVRNRGRPSKMNRPRSEHICNFETNIRYAPRIHTDSPKESKPSQRNAPRRFLANKRTANRFSTRRPNA
jgi:hypothetical protein